MSFVARKCFCSCDGAKLQLNLALSKQKVGSSMGSFMDSI
ncbi:hypothetical protein HMPREF9144_0383 [Prevotella pallens ATCC 700821]|uniref:Uncharacterized protein n=1 Tax=Prevotella pallens ATCC 700821 TaxID=997353 RepID=F9DFE3_9BACT|nr:hypothetical protein HMPREF9144_0383 [Prevotella pallens ATCC 700821]